MKTIKYFDTERDAEKSKRKYKKYSNTKNFVWTVQGNALVRIPRTRYRRRRKLGLK